MFSSQCVGFVSKFKNQAVIAVELNPVSSLRIVVLPRPIEIVDSLETTLDQIWIFGIELIGRFN